ncbi:MAG: hypothetical protein A3H98_13635 [Bacteroidetes bacterium RIFCSPLOWO2_02_FULL_36_8]|nr:MAG: hypothetical protein A3H98_13635 [Bacteroidetes bacterium RIFCSPLOWO2_02_FULL_36_8]OFY71035.1 MAG: hypothetical protein A3G23_12130 [Bacteroidetes bacterium RIFCSPLOWO2_12_FULL_37_12]
MKNLKYLFFLLFLISGIAISQPLPQSLNSSELRLALKKLSVAGSVLYIAAHPDDENTRLLSFLANEKLVITSYLSITRGDGGQNLIGTEQGDLLGMVRTQELLSARKIDKARQYFTRARDFGFSKTPEETMTIWNKDSVLSDVVWLIRNVRPDIIINRFPSNGDGGHGHHTASAILAEIAFDAAADSTQFKWQLNYVKPWKCKRLLWNTWVQDTVKDLSPFYKLDIGAYNPLLGKSYGEIAAQSRTMHKSQGFGSASTRGSKMEYFKHIKGDSSESNDIFEGISVDISRTIGTNDYGTYVGNALQSFNDNKPYLVAEILLKALKSAENIKDEYWKEKKKEDIKQIIQQCLGVWLEVTSKEKFIVPGKDLKVNMYALNMSPLPITIERLKIAGLDSSVNAELKLNESFLKDFKITIPSTTPYTTPFWLKNKGAEGLHQLEDITLVGRAENKPVLEAIFTLIIHGEKIEFHQPLIFKWTDPVEGEKQRNIEVVPPVTVNFQTKSYIFKPSQTKKMIVWLETHFQNIKGKLLLEMPEGWSSTPAEFAFDSLTTGEKKEFSFLITSPPHLSNGFIKVYVETGDKRYSSALTEINYSHIPEMILVSESRATLTCTDYSMKAKTIGYINGAGDDVSECIEQMGGTVVQLNEHALSTEDLSRFDVIVTGIRAYNTNQFMQKYHTKLMKYIFNGGTLLVQYNTNNFLGTVKSEMGPFPFKISRERVTVENSPVSITDSSHPLLNFPNKITEKDFEGWIQERGLYFVSDMDKSYKTILSMNDPGEKPSSGSIITAKYGKGHFIYTGLSFFRQLPAGVPGAYRLFANLLSIRK